MARLRSFRQDAKAMEEGEWIPLGDEYGDLEIRTRALNDAYFDGQAARLRRAAQGFGGDVSKVPSAIRRAINLELLVAHVLLDVRNLEDDDGQPVSLDRFRELIRQPDYAELLVACFRAASMVGVRRDADVEEGVPLSKSASATS